jgi:hypothetical protein
MESPAVYASRLAVLVLLSTASLSAQWVQTNGPAGGHVYALFASGSNLVAGTFDGPYVSTNGGTSWARVSSGIQTRFVYAFSPSPAGLIAGTDRGVFLSSDGGMNWTESDSGLGGRSVGSFAVLGSGLFAGSLGGGVYL